MGAQGNTTVDFGSFPGKHDASVAVTGQAGILSGSLVEAWIRPVATADHSADEHLVESIRVLAGNIVAGTGFTIYAFNNWQAVPDNPSLGTNTGLRDKAPRLYGLWTVAWVWN